MSNSDGFKSEPIARLFNCKNLVYVTTLMGDASPELSPTWVDLEGNTILVNTAEGRISKEIFLATPEWRSVVDHSNPYEW